MAHTAEIPPDLRVRLETARLDLLALFRALDRMPLRPTEVPKRLIHQLFELDADYAEALWALDQPPASLDLRAVLRDTLAALMPFWSDRKITVRNGLDPAEAYSMVPGRSPETVKHPAIPD